MALSEHEQPATNRAVGRPQNADEELALLTNLMRLKDIVARLSPEERQDVGHLLDAIAHDEELLMGSGVTSPGSGEDGKARRGNK